MESEIHRPLADYSANIWKDSLTSFSTDPGNDMFKERHATLKEVVKESFMSSKANPIENIKLIDALCRLGVSYHYERDIVEQLDKLFVCPDFDKTIRQDGCDLYTVGILFQVFRQFGFKISADVFEKFTDEDGKFKGHLVGHANGMLSLYEAAQWSTHGEDIIDEALAFSRAQFEHKREHVATGIDCYMNQFGVSKERAVEVMGSIVSDAWKDLNQELMRPHAIPFHFLVRVFNLSRVIDVFYRYQDSYTHPKFLKEHIVSLLVESIPI